MTQRALIIFARAPDLGYVKTRIGGKLGPDVALAIYRELGSNTVQAARAVGDCEITVHYTPVGSESSLAAWLGADLAFRPQADGDLGSRLSAAIDHTVHCGARRIIAIGMDCPSLDAVALEDAFEALNTADVVLGPAVDGGYYLIGITRSQPTLFRDIPWGSAECLGATLTAASAATLRVTLLDTRSDIDTAEDWQRWIESRDTIGYDSAPPHELPAPAVHPKQ